MVIAICRFDVCTCTQTASSCRVSVIRCVLELSFLVAGYVFFPPSAVRVQAYERADTSRWGRRDPTLEEGEPGAQTHFIQIPHSQIPYSNRPQAHSNRPFYEETDNEIKSSIWEHSGARL